MRLRPELRCISLAVLACVAAGCKDVCHDVDGACVALSITADGARFPSSLPPEFDRIDIHLGGAANGMQRTSLDAGRAELPTAIALALGEMTTGSLQIEVTGSQHDRLRFSGRGSVEVAPGAHFALTIDAAYVSGRLDGDLGSSP